jgi:hypothetical protein
LHSNKNIESLSDKEPDVAEKSEAPNASVVSMTLYKEIVLSLDKTSDSDASSKFMDELEKLCSKALLLIFHFLFKVGKMLLRKGEDVASETYGYNKTFGTNLKGKFLFVGGAGISRDDDPYSFYMLWHAPGSLATLASSSGVKL